MNNYVHDNAIIMGAAPDSLSLSWLQDWNGGIFATSSHNRGGSNTYWYPTPENGFARFGWDGPVAHLSDVSATPAGSGSYLSDADEQQVLIAGGIALSP